MMHTRRAFLKQLSAATAVGLGVGEWMVPRELWSLAPAALLPRPVDEALLRELAAAALEAARAAGAEFADVRIGSGRSIRVRSEYRPGGHRPDPWMHPPNVQLAVGYGVRVLVGGAWGFAGGFEMTPAGAQTVARAAVLRARATISPNQVELAATPTVSDGRWATPVERNAFDVPLGEQGDLQLEALGAITDLDAVRRAVVDFGWQETDRVFASTAGTMLVQRLYRAVPFSFAAATAEDAYSGTSESIESFRTGGYGYEAVAGVDAVGELRDAAERAIERSKALTPPLSVGVGRYDLVLSAATIRSVIEQTLARPLDAERVLGYQTNRGGTSFASPPPEVLDQMEIASALVTLRADRSRPHGCATVRWDDEGVPPTDATLVEDGVVTDYMTTRETVAELGAAYPRSGRRAHSNGCATGAGQELPGLGLPNLTLEPGADDLSEDDLISGVDRGFYVEAAWGSADHQLLSAQYGVGVGRAWEIRNGRKVNRIRDMAFQAVMPQLWKNLDALGGAASAEEGTLNTPFSFNRHPLQQWFSSASSVPARFRGVNVLNTGRTE